MNILLLAEPFGFGPSGSLMSCKERLSGKNYKWKFAGATFAESVINPEGFEDILSLDDNFNIDDPQLTKFIDWADVIISGTEFRICDVLAGSNKKVIVYDPLVWFWQDAPNLSYSNMYYICQNFINTDITTLSAKYGRRFFVVNPPIIEKYNEYKPEWGTHLIVNLCGLYNPICVLDGYYELILDSLFDAVDGLWKEVTVTGNKYIFRSLPRKYTDKFRFKSYDHKTMLAAIEQCNLFLTSPGLNSSLEAIGLGTPLGFLPPQNNSQAAQLRIFQQFDLSPVGMDWENITNREWQWDNQAPHEAIRVLREAMICCSFDPESKINLRNNLFQLTTMDAKHWEIYRKRQADFFASLISEKNQDVETVFETIINET